MPNPPLVDNEGSNQDTATQMLPLDGSVTDVVNKDQAPDTIAIVDESNGEKETNQYPPTSSSAITQDESSVAKA